MSTTFVPNTIPELISTEAMGCVLACHDAATDSWTSFSSGVRTGSESHWAEIGRRHPYRAFDSWPGGIPHGAQNADPLKHIIELLGRTREQKLQYLADSGMEEERVSNLTALVAEWLNDSELSRLQSLSRTVVSEEKGAAELFRRWVDWQSLLRLAISLYNSDLKDYRLASAYALAHAVTVAAASYRADSVSAEPLTVVPGDDLD